MYSVRFGLVICILADVVRQFAQCAPEFLLLAGVIGGVVSMPDFLQVRRMPGSAPCTLAWLLCMYMHAYVTRLPQHVCGLLGHWQ